MTMRSKQWYTKTSRLPNSFVNVSIGRPPQIRSCQHDHRSDGRWSQNFKYVWLAVRRQSLCCTQCAARLGWGGKTSRIAPALFYLLPNNQSTNDRITLSKRQVTTGK